MIGGRIGIVHLQRTGFGARIRERIADQQTFRLGGRIHGGDAGNAGGIDHKNEGPGGINRRVGCAAPLLGEEALNRPTGQPD